MQVQHEARLLEPGPMLLSNGDHATADNPSPDAYSLAAQQSNMLCPIERLTCCSPPNSLLAAHLSHTNQIVLFDTKSYQKRERFPLKACDKKYSRQSFQVSAMDFSRDGKRLAVGQTDCIIYIYKLAQTAPPVGNPTAATNLLAASDSPVNSKPTTISGKFAAASPITCLIWCELGILFGSQDGRLRLILSPGDQQRPSNVGLPAQNGAPPLSEPQPGQGQSTATAPRVIHLYQAPSINSVPISLSFKAPLILIGQLDCKVHLLALANEQASMSPQDSPLELPASQGQGIRRNSSASGAPIVRQNLIIGHSCPPLHVSCLPNSTICCAGSDGRVAFHSVQISHNSLTSVPLQVIDLREDIQSADLSPINEILVVITRRRLMFIKFDQEFNSWRLQPSLIEFRGLFGLSTVRWLRDGSQLALGHSNSALDLFKCSWQKQAINEQLDICHIARNRIRITDRERNLLATYKTQHDIKRVHILDQNQSVIIWTSSSLLLARLNCQIHSEIGWPLSPSGRNAKSGSKFLFEPSGFVLIYFESTSECHLIRLGDNYVRYCSKIPQVRRLRLSIRQFPPIGELCGSNQVGSSPSGLRTGSTSARADSARSLRSSTANELASDDSLNFASESNLPKSFSESQFERFAYVSGEQKTQLNVVELKKPAKLIYSREFDAQIASVKFSCTSSYLIVMEEDQLERLHLIKISPRDKRQFETGLAFESMAILDKCHFADWLPETDVLVVQIEWTIQIWFDLDEFNRTIRLDCRSFNYAKRAPLLDLSVQPDQTQAYPRCLKVVCEPTNQCDLLLLSNGQQLPLDRVRRRFYEELTLCKLESAFELLQKQPSEQQTSFLFTKLGWRAIDRADCELAIKIFSRIQHRSLVAYLAKCQSLKRAHEAKAASQVDSIPEKENRDESGLMLAKLRGDWLKFEELASDQELILATYKRLNRWTLCLDYLTRNQQFRQRDIAQSEHEHWLISRGRFMEAAKSRVEHSADLIGALDLLMDQKQFRDACDLMLAEQKNQLSEVAQHTQNERRIRELADSLTQNLSLSGEHFRAAQLSERILDKKREAVDLYLKAQKFDMALALANQLTDLDVEKVNQMHIDYARHLKMQARQKLIGKRRTRLALDHFIEAGSHLEALEFAAEFCFHREAGEILEKYGQHLVEMNLQNGDSSREVLFGRLKLAAERFISSGRDTSHEVASKLFELAEEYEKVVELLIENGELERAFKIALEKVFGNNSDPTRNNFMDLAEQLATERNDQHKLSRAEKIYLLVDRPDLAIEMYRKLGLHDQMLGLIERHQPDQLESSLLQLARSLESAGRLEEAESYLIRASPTEWTGVVRMYRMAQRWPDAFRVARANCVSEEDPLLIQLAYRWAKSLVAPGGRAGQSREKEEENLAAARKLLAELQLTKQVVEFCCETKNYPFAIELTSGDAQLASLRRDIVVRYAAHLERQHKFADAERVLLENRLVELASRMYLDNDQHQESVRVIEQQLSQASDGDRPELIELLNKRLVECARRLAESASSRFRRTPPIMLQRNDEELPDGSSDLHTAQQMFLRAQKPELAIEMYQSMGLWQEALQVAQRFAPRLLEDVERALDAQVGQEIEPILRSSQSKQDTIAIHQAKISDEKLNGETNQLDLVQNQSQFSGQPTDELWKQLCEQLNQDNRREARASLAKYLNSLASIERDSELALHLDQLTRIVAEPNSWLSIIMCQQTNSASLSHLSERIFVQTNWTSRVWPSLLSLLIYHQLASRRAGEVDSKLQKRCIITLHVTIYNALEELLREALLRLETNGSDRTLAANAGTSTRKSGALFARKTRRVPHSHLAAEQPSNNPKEQVPSWLTIKQVERLLQLANCETDRSHQVADILDLLAKLSFGLLRHADQLEAAHLLLVAGRWQLALGRRKLARDIWTSLIELIDRTDELQESQRQTPNSFHVRFSELIELPESLLVFPQKKLKPAGGQQQQQLAEVRQWLLEWLIGGQHPSGSSAGKLPAGWAILGSQPVCLVCGLPADSKSRLVPPNGGLALRRAEFATICELIGLKLESKAMSEPTQLAHLLRDNKKTFSPASERLRRSTELAVDLVVGQSI